MGPLPFISSAPSLGQLCRRWRDRAPRGVPPAGRVEASRRAPSAAGRHGSAQRGGHHRRVAARPSPSFPRGPAN